MLLLLFLYRSKSDLLYYAEYLPTISTQLKIISSVKAATPSDISVCWTWFWMVHFCEWQESKKLWIPVCPLVKQLSHFACRGHFLLVLVNDLLRRWLAQTLAHWASEFWKLLDQQENLLVPDYQTEHLSSRADGVILSINQSINQSSHIILTCDINEPKKGWLQKMYVQNGNHMR